MKVRILQKFHDKANYMTVYLVGETVAFDDARAESLIKRGLVESAEEPIEPEEVQKGVKPVAAKRKNQPKDN